VMDEAALGAWLLGATHSVDRLQAQSYYADDAELAQRWAAGEPGPDMGPVGAWHDYLAADKDRGVTWRQLLILAVPLNDYWRSACEWGFAYHAAHEQIRVLAGENTPLEDFYVIDGHNVVKMHYDWAGKFLGAEPLGRARSTSYAHRWNRQWERAEDFQAWWDRHPQYRRGARTAA
jgi:hypothetical protein